jgi:hypothetical protein
MGQDKGIRLEAKREFARLLPTRVNTRDGNRNFRAAVNTHLMESFGCTLAAAATHYNHAFIEARKAAAEPGNEALQALLEGLGRPEDKKGGRKPKAKAAAEAPQEVMEETPTLFLVKKAKGGEQVGEPCSLEEAKARVAANVGVRFAPKLYWIAA